MACLMIDYENSSGRYLEGISLVGLNKNDEVIIFYSNNVQCLPIGLFKEFEIVPAKKIFIKAETGSRNSLDFQLSTYLGACIHKHPAKEYYIVSQDHGYDCLCRFWERFNISVKRIDKICHYSTNNLF